MSGTSSKPTSEKRCRVHRGPPPLVPKRLRRDNYRAALDCLLRDFGSRCAYCMRYLPFKSEIHVDHFDPTHKDDKYQQYTNLFPADARCNLTKSDQWPTEEERAQGIRFLNCCEEVDYGECIFEDPETGKLVGTTVAARYHIEALQLNCSELCRFRQERTRMARVIASADHANVGAASDPHASAVVEELRRDLEQKIPLIPPPPTR